MILKIRFINSFFLLSLFLVGCSTTTDIEKPPDEQFVKIHLQYGFVDDLNTFEGTFTKDLVMDGSVTVEFWLSKEDQESIKEMAEHFSFFNLPDNIPAIAGESIEPDPSPDSLRISFGSMDKTVVWFYPIGDNDSDSKKIIELADYIMSIVQQSETYKSLPDAIGGRQ